MAKRPRVHRRDAISLKPKKDARGSNGFAPPGPPGNRRRSSAIPPDRPSGFRARPGRLVGTGDRAFFLVLRFLASRIEEAQKRPLPARRCCSPAPQNHRPGQLAAHIALGITWSGRGLVGGRWQEGAPPPPEEPIIARARQPFHAQH
jgi:hypothetical protein